MCISHYCSGGQDCFSGIPGGEVPSINIVEQFGFRDSFGSYRTAGIVTNFQQRKSRTSFPCFHNTPEVGNAFAWLGMDTRHLCEPEARTLHRRSGQEKVGRRMSMGANGKQMPALQG